MRVLVTGASGFVGTRLLQSLSESSHQTVATVQPGHRLDDFPETPCFEVDLVDSGAVTALVERSEVDVIVHLAALSDVAASWKQVADCFQVNVLGTEAILRAAGDRLPIVFASSAEVYGAVTPDQLPLQETAPLRPSTPYAMSKACCELLALRHGARVVRSFNLVGPGQSPRFAISSFAHQLRALRDSSQERVLRVGNLESQRDFLHVDDGAAAYRTVVERGAASAVYNLSSGRARRISEVLAQLITVTGLEVRIEQDPERMRPSDVPIMAGDSSRLRELGWQPERTLADALRDLWQSLQ